jgi:beta-lactam-binding protein with PASTA domain
MKRILVFLITISFALSVNAATEKKDTLRVPDTKGLNSSGAVFVLEKAGFQTEIAVVSDEGKPGSVVKLLIDGKDIRPWAAAQRGTLITIGIVKESLASVPNIIGKTVDEAENSLKQNNLQLGKTQEEESIKVKAGRIIKQKPSAGKDVEKGSKIEVVIAKQTMAKTPDLTGMEVEKAIDILGKNRMALGDIKTEYSDASPGKIIGQNPSAGLEVSPSTTVNIVVAKEMKVQVPSLRGRTKVEAEKYLTNAGLKLGKITERVDNQRRSGTVVSQKPSPYSKASKGTTVDIVVSKRHMVALPNVFGLKEQDAKNKLSQLGFRVTIKTVETDMHQSGTVIKMHPSNGNFAKGSPVFLTVAKAKPEPIATSVTNTFNAGSQPVN